MSNESKSSNLKHDAEEFIPKSELIVKTHNELIIMMEKLFNPDVSDQGICNNLKRCLENAPTSIIYSVSEIWAHLSISKFEQVPVGFHYFKELRAYLPPNIGNTFEQGFLNSLESIVVDVISDISNSACDLQNITLSEVLSSELSSIPPNACKNEKIFSIVVLFRLIITCLNANDETCNCTGTPPVQACIMYCFLVETICEHIIKHPSKSQLKESDSLHVINDCTSKVEQLTNIFLYTLFGAFYQSVPYFNRIIVENDPTDICSTWRQACSLDDTNVTEKIALSQMLKGCDLVSNLSVSVKRCLGLMRKLLIDQCLLNRQVRGMVLEILLHVVEMTALHSSDDYQLSQVMEDDEMAEYEKFLKESGQLS